MAEADSKFDFDSNSPSNPSFFVPSFDDFDPGPDSTDSDSGQSDFYDDDEEDQFSYVTNLFNTQIDSNFNSRVLSDREELRLGSEFDGLRVVGSGSESDSEEMEVNSGVIDPRGDSGVPGLWSFSRVDEEGDSEDVEVNSGVIEQSGDSGLWSCSRVDELGDLYEDFEWEEVDERVEARDNVSYVIDRMEEISVSSDTSSDSEQGNSGLVDRSLREQIRTLQLELLAAVHILEREFDNVVRIQENGVFGAEYHALFGFIYGSEGTLKGSPPAAKSVVENLPLVILKDEELREGNAACAVCKDEILISEEVTKLPCSHYYHCDCIVPWLNIRNTCPVCRHELPTDDADYESRRNGRSAAAAFINDFQVREDFEPVP